MFHLFFHIEKKEVTQVWSNMKVSTVNDETIHLWVHYPFNSPFEHYIKGYSARR